MKILLLCIICLSSSYSLSLHQGNSNVNSFKRPSDKTVNNRPIIGILAQATDGYKADYGDSYIYSAYVKFVESGGARAVPIRVNMNEDYYTKLFSKINGAILPGGDVNSTTSYNAQVTEKLIKYSQDRYKAGDYFPILGICLGFETLLVKLSGNDDLLGKTDAYYLNLPLDFANGYAHSRMFGSLPSHIHKIITSQALLANAHHYGVTLKSFDESKKLWTAVKLLATNKDRAGLEFISAFETHDVPIYGVQFHPEKNTYVWADKFPWVHSHEAILVTQYFANFIVSEARKNSHKFASEKEAYGYVIDNHLPIMCPFNENPFEMFYVFNFTKT